MTSEKENQKPATQRPTRKDLRKAIDTFFKDKDPEEGIAIINVIERNEDVECRLRELFEFYSPDEIYYYLAKLMGYAMESGSYLSELQKKGGTPIPNVLEALLDTFRDCAEIMEPGYSF